IGAAKGTEQQAMPPVIKPFPHVLKSILYTFLYTFSRRLMTYSGKYLPEFFRLSPMKLVDALRYGNPHNDT
ncbi:TPA: hypothetical protein ACHK6I_005112, partial [Escherichia coli]